MRSVDRKALEFQSAVENHNTTVLGTFPPGTFVERTEQRELYRCSTNQTGELVFDVRGVKNAILSGSIPYEVVDGEITQAWVDNVKRIAGLSMKRLAELTDKDLRRLGVAVTWNGGALLLIDGNHRLVRRHELGLDTFRHVRVHVKDCTPWICRAGEEWKFYTTLSGTPT